MLGILKQYLLAWQVLDSMTAGAGSADLDLWSGFLQPAALMIAQNSDAGECAGHQQVVEVQGANQQVNPIQTCR